MFVRNISERIILIALLILINNAVYAEEYKVTGYCIAGNTEVNIVNFGAAGDGITDNTKAIQAAIDSVNKLGGGRVIIPEGRFLTGSILMKDNVELYVSKNAALTGSDNIDKYKKTIRWFSLILAHRAKNIAISGEGIIDGEGRRLALNIDSLVRSGKISDPEYNYKRMRPNEKLRPQLIEFLDCSNVTVKNVTLKNSACWVAVFHNCHDMIINRVKVESTAYWNNDGLDISDCRRCSITDCDINSADDGICFKSYDSLLACDSINVRNCKIRSSATALKFGTSSFGGFKNIFVDSLYIYNTFRTAVAIEVVDGGVAENIHIKNIYAKNTAHALFLRVGKRNKYAETGSMKNIFIENLKVEVPSQPGDAGYDYAGPIPDEPHNLYPSSIVGLENSRIQNVYLKNIEVIFAGGGRKEIAYRPTESLHLVPEREDSYPEFSTFGELPAWGFFIRHAKGISIKNLSLRLLNDDYRPAIVCKNVDGISIDRGVFPRERTGRQIVLEDVSDGYFNININPGKEGFIIKQGKCKNINTEYSE